MFGNEATGLSDDYLNENAVRIEQSDEVDSLNLATAVVVALYYLK
ncbi:MAG: TrmH family RNA methyltransferase [Bacilli bacterium]|nr:TrmH family RNA methyltransferase [Bacilli bacterium]